MTIYLKLGGEWPLTLERCYSDKHHWRGECKYARYARWLCFEFLWRAIK